MSTDVRNGAKGVLFTGFQRPHYSSRCTGNCNAPDAACRVAMDMPPEPIVVDRDPYGVAERAARKARKQNA